MRLHNLAARVKVTIDSPVGGRSRIKGWERHRGRSGEAIDDDKKENDGWHLRLHRIRLKNG